MQCQGTEPACLDDPYLSSKGLQSHMENSKQWMETTVLQKTCSTIYNNKKKNAALRELYLFNDKSVIFDS